MEPRVEAGWECWWQTNVKVINHYKIQPEANDLIMQNSKIEAVIKYIYLGSVSDGQEMNSDTIVKKNLNYRTT
eukprot:snap_masked-scaffold_49-processed-gene-1.25-mRNA-1 protein AED:1.00 eAED:1.00 QI:0/-1/0/0/-1/1/1/0/72